MEIEKRISNYPDGSYGETYHKKGDKDYYHREDGPASVVYNPGGSIRFEAYYIKGLYIPKEQWEQKYGWKSKLKGTPMEAIYK